MLPAHAGMIPTTSDGTTALTCAPRTCGDDPGLEYNPTFAFECSPHMRG